MLTTRKWLHIGSAVVVVLAVFASRFPIAFAARHIFTGNSFQFGGLRVPIPLEWYGKCDQNGMFCGLVTFSPLVTFGKYETVEVGFHKIVVDSPQTYDPQWSQRIVDQLSRQGYSVTHTSELEVASIPTTCFEADMAKDRQTHHIFCHVEGRMVVEFHYSGKEQRDRFYAILRGIK
jgi:hypothetical protein